MRQRQFRWKNAENGFSLEDQRPENGEANEGSGDEENEHLWRKIRYEREQLLLEKGLKAVTTTFPYPNNVYSLSLFLIGSRLTFVYVHDEQQLHSW